MEKSLIVSGSGIAASVLGLQAQLRGIKVFRLPSGTPGSSLLASGIYNPIVLKRMRLVWRWRECLEAAERFYREAEERFSVKFVEPEKVFHKIANEAELNRWQGLRADAPWNELLGEPIEWRGKWFGAVLRSGWIRVPKLLECFEEFTPPIDLAGEAPLVYCHGWAGGDRADGLPEAAFNPVKGEVLRARLPGYSFDGIAHGSVFVLPLGEELFQIGATYQWDKPDEKPSSEGQAELLKGLRSIWDGTAEIVEHRAAVRPATRDRRPLMGRVGPNRWVLNGLGSRGVLMAPLLAAELLDQIFESAGSFAESDWSRFSGS
jgi:glycine/D-amino acid oxidase-like deaminating enzyme